MQNVFLGGTVGPLHPCAERVECHCPLWETSVHISVLTCKREWVWGAQSFERLLPKAERDSRCFLGLGLWDGGGCLNSNHPPRGMGTLGLQAAGHTCSKYSVPWVRSGVLTCSLPQLHIFSTRFGPCLLSPASFSRVF